MQDEGSALRAGVVEIENPPNDVDIAVAESIAARWEKDAAHLRRVVRAAQAYRVMLARSAESSKNRGAIGTWC